MKKYRVTVNGKSYQVEVEEVRGKPSPPKPPLSSPPPRPAAPAPPKTPPPAEPTEGGKTAIKAPMPGTILDIKVSEGDETSLGQILLILEAMKMENEIPAPVAGTVAEVAVKTGDTVRSGDILVVIE